MMASNLFLSSITLSSLTETRALAHRIAAQLQLGDVVTLMGDLGTGKTAFCRELIQYFLPGEEVLSPTFSLVQVYETPQFPLWHFDLYRLQQPQEVLELGLEEALTTGVCLIEWPQIAAEFLPEERIEIQLAFGEEEEERKVVISKIGNK